MKVRPSAQITYPWNVSLGSFTYVGDEAVLYSLTKIRVGEHVSISYRSFLCTGTHDMRDRRFPLVLKPISIGNQAWIAADAFVAPGVTVGDGAVVGARSSVFSDVGPLEVHVGNPAKKVGYRTNYPSKAEFDTTPVSSFSCVEPPADK